MKAWTALVSALAALTMGVPVAAADPDGYQPQLRQTDSSDAFTRYVRNNAPDGYQLRQTDSSDAFTRYARNNAPDGYQSQLKSGAVTHPDSLGERPSLAAAPTVEPATGDFAWDEFVAGIAGGIMLAGIAGTIAFMTLGRGRLAHS